MALSRITRRGEQSGQRIGETESEMKTKEIAAPRGEQEWTPEYVGSLVGETFNGAWKIADAHNAALAAERKDALEWFIGYRAQNEHAEKLVQQLAAERDAHAKTAKQLSDSIKNKHNPLVDALVLARRELAAFATEYSDPISRMLAKIDATIADAGTDPDSDVKVQQ